MTARDPGTALAATTTSDWVGAGDRDRGRAADRVRARPDLRLARAPDRQGGRRRREVTPETATRLRFMRRLLYAVIILLGVAIALSNFDGVNQVARSLLASGAIAAAILGFAARQTLANFVAGVMLAVTQPLRVGDWVYVEDQYGVVDDIRLTYTYLHTLGGQTVVIPNEKLASGILRNDTLGDGRRRASRWDLAAPGGRRRARVRRCRRRPGSRSRSPRRTRRASGSRCPASAARRPSGRRTRPRCACAASTGCAPTGCSPTRGRGSGARRRTRRASYNHVSRCPTPSAPGAGAAAAERRAASSSSPSWSWSSWRRSARSVPSATSSPSRPPRRPCPR